MFPLLSSAIAPAKPSKDFSSAKVLAHASLKDIPSVTRVTILAATAPLTISSPTPVQETPHKVLAKFPATVDESETLPGISNPFPPAVSYTHLTLPTSDLV